VKPARLTCEIDIVKGVEGMSLYVNCLRIAGPKPWGGGKILYHWEVTFKDLQEAMDFKP
jgi:hypothetical protein